ncbi:MAG TPA: protein kinase [Vicinamibacteria bacterium]|nr:protein kinase [Vicinamibacteria bacterium]
MTPERWAEIKELAAAALELPPEGRAGFLERACPDPSVRKEVESLLAFEKDSYLETTTLSSARGGDALATGTSLDAYEIVSAIGAGAMGDVYRARDTKLERDVAIKVLPKEFARVGERLERFEREARLLASLNHRGIATLHGLERYGETRYLVMELVEGETLEERIEKGPLAVDEALALAKQIAEALESAHMRGVIHRDLKPANIKITPDGQVKVLDFGLAKALDDDPIDASASTGTRAGTILGTAAYMSPEQARAQFVDTRTDIWAFGCVVYEMLTGHRAFPAEAVPDIFAAVVGEEPDWNALPLPTPIRVKDMLRRCLRKDAFTRLRDIGDARIEIDDAWNEPLASEKAPVRRPLPLALVVPALVTVVALSLFVWTLMHSGASPGRITRVVVPLDPAEVLARHTELPSVAISPDGRYVAYVAGESNLYLRSMDEERGKLVSGTEEIGAPFFSPDGRWVGFYSSADRKLVKVSVSGGAPVTIAETGTVLGASFAADGTIVFAPDKTMGLSRVAADGAVEILTEPDRGRGEKSHRFPEMLPGDEAVLFTLGTGDIASWDDASIAVLSLDTGEYRVVLERGMHPRYSPTGHLVYARAGDLFSVPFDLDTLEVTGAPERALRGVITSPVSGTAEFALSREGSLIYAAGSSWEQHSRVVSIDRQGREEPLIETVGAFQNVRLSPDGRQLALEIGGANQALWTYDLSRTTMTRLAYGYDNQYPIWSIDAKRVTFTSNRGGQKNLFSQRADGSDDAERLTESDQPQQAGSWSPDGATLAFEEQHYQTNWDLWLLSADGTTRPFLQSPFVERHPAFSPDGRFVAYESDESGRPEIHVRSFPDGGEKWQVSTNGGHDAAWGADGRELFYRNGQQFLVVETDLSGELVLGEPELLFERTTDVVAYDVMPDSERFVVAEAKEEVLPTRLNLVLNWSRELERLR